VPCHDEASLWAVAASVAERLNAAIFTRHRVCSPSRSKNRPEVGSLGATAAPRLATYKHFPQKPEKNFMKGFGQTVPATGVTRSRHPGGGAGNVVDQTRRGCIDCRDARPLV